MLPAVIDNKPVSLSDTMQIGKVMAESGFFQDSKGMAQAVVKILAGQELGLPPFAAMTGIHLINGRPSIGANLMAATIKKSGRYDYKVATLTETLCEIVFLERGQEIGRSKFSLDDARKAGTKNLDKFPRNMLFARAISNGVKWFCPDTFGGAPVYTPEELGADVNEDGDIVQGSYTAPEPQPNGNGHEPASTPIDTAESEKWAVLAPDLDALAEVIYQLDQGTACVFKKGIGGVKAVIQKIAPDAVIPGQNRLVFLATAKYMQAMADGAGWQAASEMAGLWFVEMSKAIE
jgi:hypothetical protein